MLPTNLQPLDRFKAVQPVSKPSLSTYVCNFIVAHAAPGLRTCAMCAMYMTDTASCREACGVVVYRECLFFYVCFSKATLITGAVQEQEMISVYCLCHQLQSRRMLECSVCGEHYHRQCVSWKGKSQPYCCQDCKKKK